MGSLNTWSGTISAIGGSVVSGGLGMVNLGNADGFNSLQIGQIGQLNGFAGSLASTAIGYGITGNASFNLVRLNGTGLLEMNLGKDGFNMQLGMGGTDISLGRISGALAGASHWGKNIQIEKAAKRDGLGNAATALRAQYGFGDGMQRAQLESILKGDTVLAKRAGKGSDAETVTKDGKRTVYLDNYKDTMSADEKLAMGITLGHEAYRDGLVGTEQQQFMETTRAVIGHTEMALRMQADKRYSESMDSIIAGSAVLQKDIAAYKSGDLMTMLGHVAGNYDYSKDYWRVELNEIGEVVRVLDDKDYDTISIIAADKSILTVKRNTRKSLSEQIQQAVFPFQTLYKQNKEDIINVMYESGLKWDGQKGWHAVDERGIYESNGRLHLLPYFIAVKEGNGAFERLLEADAKKKTTEHIDITQEEVEESSGLPKHSACAITAGTELNNNFFRNTYGNGLSKEELLEAIKENKNEMFDTESLVLTWNGLGAGIAKRYGTDNYLLYAGEYDTVEDIQNAGINYWLKKAIRKDDPTRTHFISVTYGDKDDTDTTTTDRWWNDTELTSFVYYGFKPKFGEKK